MGVEGMAAQVETYSGQMDILVYHCYQGGTDKGRGSFSKCKGTVETGTWINGRLEEGQGALNAANLWALLTMRKVKVVSMLITWTWSFPCVHMN